MRRKLACALLLCLGLFALARPVDAAIALDAATPCTPTNTAVNSVQWSHTTSGGNRVLIVGVAIRNSGSQFISSVTYAGTPLTSVLAATNGTSVRVETWRLVAPALGANNVVVTLSGGATAKMACGSVSLTGVDQTNPIDASNSATGTSATPSVTVTTVTNNAWVVDAIAFRSSGNANPTGTAGGSQTQRWSGYTEGGGSLVNIRGKGSTEGPKSPAGAVVMDWNLSGTSPSVDWAAVGVALKPDVCGAVTVSDASYVAANAQSGQATAYWSSANAALILRKTAAFIGEAPDNGTTYAVNATIGAATVVDNDSVAKTSFNQTGLTNGTTYYYRVFPKDSTPCYASGSGTEVNASPVAASTGTAWSYMMAGGSMLKAGITGNGTIYTSSNASRIISLNTADGTQSWEPVATSAAIQGWLVWVPISPGGATTVAIGGDQAGKVYSVNAATGAKSWTEVTTGADAAQAPAAGQLRDYSNAAFQSAYTTDVIFAASRNSSTTNNKVYAIRASDGAVLWTFNGTGTSSVDYIVGMPYVDYSRNRIYVASRAGTGGTQDSLWVINTLNGALVASFALGHLETSPTLSYDGNTLYVGNTAGDLYAINTATLALKWTSPSALGTAITGFVWEDWTTAGRLYFSTANGNVWCLQDPGAGAPPSPTTPVWKTAVAGASTPVLLSALYVGSSDGKLHRLNISTGVDEKQFVVGDGTSTVGDPSTEDTNQVFVGTTAGKIYKIPLPLP